MRRELVIFNVQLAFVVSCLGCISRKEGKILLTNGETLWQIGTDTQNDLKKTKNNSVTGLNLPHGG